VGLRSQATCETDEGAIAPDDDLLRPTFYMAAELNDWLPARIAGYKASRSRVM